jgi:hypothetical protein
MVKPVAWMLNGKLHDCDPSDWAKEQYPDQDVIPLYTAPRELSDEEIMEFTKKYDLSPAEDDVYILLVRDCLKKASEK